MHYERTWSIEWWTICFELLLERAYPQYRGIDSLLWIAKRPSRTSSVSSFWQQAIRSWAIMEWSPRATHARTESASGTTRSLSVSSGGASLNSVAMSRRQGLLKGLLYGSSTASLRLRKISNSFLNSSCSCYSSHSWIEPIER